MENRCGLSKILGYGIMVLLHIISCDGMRGPHHPRGSSVSAHNHVHYVPKKQDYPVKLIQDDQLLHDTQHLREDTGWLDDKTLEQMSPEELDLEYFRSHDFDNNTKLDGLEILQAIQHTLPPYEGEEGAGSAVGAEPDAFPAMREAMLKRMAEEFEYFVSLIDQAFEEDDLDHDGYLSYTEFAISRKLNKQNKKV